MKILSSVSVGLLSVIVGVAAARAADAPAPATPPGSTAPAASTNAATAPAKEASIPFANRDGIYDWQVENNHSVLIQAQNRKWYRATLMSNCFNLAFAQRIGFETNPGGSFDKFSAIRLRHQTCPLTSLVETAAPAKKSAKPKGVAPAAPAPSAPVAPQPLAAGGNPA